MDRVQELCFEGQNHLLATDYWSAEQVLTEAEQIALENQDWDSLSRLYMPLQEARRQRRQRSGEGIIKLDLVAHSELDPIDPDRCIEQYPHGQLLIAGFGTIEPAVRARRRVQQQKRYVDVFLAASYWVNGQVAVVIVPTEHVSLPEAGEYSLDELLRRLPAHSLFFPLKDLPVGQCRGNAQTFARTMAWFEKLHQPFLALADGISSAMLRIEGYRKVIQVDYACELAHQRLSDTARQLTRQRSDQPSVGPVSA
jgi:hypothetical protein